MRITSDCTALNPPANSLQLPPQTTLPGLDQESIPQSKAKAKPQPSTRYIDLPEVGPVLLEKSKRARRLIISVKPQRVRVAVPYRVSFRQAEEFARANRAWIKVQLTRSRERETRYQELRAGLEPLDREKARAHLVSRLEALAARHGFSYNRVTLRNQRTRWGSCSAAKNLNLNMKLLWLPADLQDYVLLHELLHTRIQNHGPRFWAELEKLCPGARQLKRRLRQYHYCLSA